jgi:hypothetical protein
VLERNQASEMQSPEFWKAIVVLCQTSTFLWIKTWRCFTSLRVLQHYWYSNIRYLNQIYTTSLGTSTWTLGFFSLSTQIPVILHLPWGFVFIFNPHRGFQGKRKQVSRSRSLCASTRKGLILEQWGLFPFLTLVRGYHFKGGFEIPASFHGMLPGPKRQVSKKLF